jgi:hypothetical protein
MPRRGARGKVPRGRAAYPPRSATAPVDFARIGGYRFKFEMAFRFVHTADMHLDLPLRTLALREPALAELIRIGFCGLRKSAMLIYLILSSVPVMFDS